MKKIIQSTLAAMVLFALAGCSKAIPATNTPATPPAVATAPVSQPNTEPTPAVTPSATDPAPAKTPAKPKVVPPAAIKLITIQNFAFSPSSLTLNQGDAVRWTNQDSAPHTVTSDTFQSPNLTTNGSFSFTFKQAGTFSYHCSIHPSMKGTIIVKP
jgi:plastocyanin